MQHGSWDKHFVIVSILAYFEQQQKTTLLKIKFAKDENKAINFALSVSAGRCLNKATHFLLLQKNKNIVFFDFPKFFLKIKTVYPPI